MENYCGYDFYEDQGAYGYYTNPHAFWDWYQIDGRWPFVFLLKSGCNSLISSDRSWYSQDAVSPPAPEGYVWTAGTRKADIALTFIVCFSIGEQFCKIHFFIISFRIFSRER